MPTAAKPESPEVVLTLGAKTAPMKIGQGSMVLVRSGERESFGAMVEQIEGLYAHLTFTPRRAPRKVPLGCILSSVGESASMDMSSVPRYQPDPTVAPRRKGPG